MKGYRTLVAQIVGMLAALIAIWGVDIDTETQAAITSGVVAVWGVVNIVLRKFTDTPVGSKVPRPERKPEVKP